MSRLAKNIFTRLLRRTGRQPERDNLPHSLPGPKTRATDRGPSKYFHGRKLILETFRSELNSSLEDADGTVVLIQGAPGAGKTALLYEAAMRAAADGWRVAEIEPNGLYDPSALAKQLGVPHADRHVVSRETTAGGKMRGVVVEASGDMTDRHTSEFRGESVEELLRAAAGARGLILVMDEAQRLQTLVNKSCKDIVETTLYRIHNGKLNAPVILLAGGLGNSANVFAEFWITRFRGRCLVHLGRLSPEAERAVIRDWLTKDGGAKGDHQALERWIEGIAAESHGWPQHVMSFVAPGVERLRTDGGQLSDKGLDAVLVDGRKRRAAYYIDRLAPIGLADRVALADLLTKNVGGIGLDESELVTAFARGRTREEGRAVFRQALHKGVITETADGDYAVPIPSMRSWLVERYADRPAVLRPHSVADMSQATEEARTPEPISQRVQDQGMKR